MKPVRFGSPGFPNLGYRMKVIDENTGEEVGPGQKGVLVMQPPLPPGCMTTIWNDDARFLSSYFSHFKELLYSSLDWAIRDEDGYTFILGRTDDVINVAGHRLGTREIEESVSGFAAVAEAAVIGVADELKGQVPVVFATLRQATEEPHERVQAADGMRRTVEQSLGAVARPAASISSMRCRRHARASCCDVRCRRWRRARIPATSPRWTTRMRWKK